MCARCHGCRYEIVQPIGICHNARVAQILDQFQTVAHGQDFGHTVFLDMLGHRGRVAIVGQHITQRVLLRRILRDDPGAVFFQNGIHTGDPVRNQFVDAVTDRAILGFRHLDPHDVFFRRTLVTIHRIAG